MEGSADVSSICHRCEFASESDSSATATEKSFGLSREDDVSLIAWRSFNFPTTLLVLTTERQALSFADENPKEARLAWSEMHSAPLPEWHLDEATRQVGGIFDVLTRSESPQLRLRRARTGEASLSLSLSL